MLTRFIGISRGDRDRGNFCDFGVEFLFATKEGPTATQLILLKRIGQGYIGLGPRGSGGGHLVRHCADTAVSPDNAACSAVLVAF